MVKIIAHRGYSKNHPENTVPAFKEALGMGAEAIELDVHATKDSKLVVHHDYYLGNPDSGEGIISQKEYAYIQGLKVGESEHIPRLSEVFQQIGNKMQYEIELKGFTPEFLGAVLEEVKKFSLLDSVEFTSPTVYCLTYLKNLEPRARTGFFATPFPSWMDAELGELLLFNNALLGKINVLHCPLSIIDVSFISDAHTHGLEIHAADCNTEEELRRAISLGVDQLSTNEFELALALSKRAIKGK